MIDDTAIGGPSRGFPATPRSAVLEVTLGDDVVRARAFAVLVRAYWKPVYKHARIKWRKSNEDAKDLTQAFFARVLEKETLATFDASKGKFRTFVRACFDHFAANEDQKSARQKRGGGASVLALDFAEADGELAYEAFAESPEEVFDREWRRVVHRESLAELERTLTERDKRVCFDVFDRYVLRGDASYAAIAAELGIKVTDVTNHLHLARREYQRIARARLSEITSNERELDDESAFLGERP